MSNQDLDSKWYTLARYNPIKNMDQITENNEANGIDSESISDKTPASIKETNNQSINWWYWATSNKNEEESKDKDPQEQHMGQATIEESSTEVTADNWNSWVSPYKIMGYLYKPTEEQQEEEQTPLLGIFRLAVDDKKEQTWWSWMWGQNQPEGEEEEEEEGEDENNAELFRRAKASIENSKNSSHYAIKNINKDFELSVSNTETEMQPVKFRTKKRPITPNELQENVIKSEDGPTSSGNEVIPKFEENFRQITWRTQLRLLGEHLIYRERSSERHLYQCDQSKMKPIKKVVIIGVHSFLPIKMVRTMIGESTGNSNTYVKQAREAVRQWMEEHDEESDIVTIALEGEGLIEERVEESFKLLKNWRKTIEASDLLIVVGHLQGSLIGIRLLENILDSYKMKKEAKVGMMSMNGVNCGPFANLSNKLVIRAYTSEENDIINELFEMSKKASKLGARIELSMAKLIHHNVKIVFSGKMNEMFIPMYSSLNMNIEHMNIYRMMYFNGETPQFIKQLMKIILLVKNYGYSDHNLIKDLSEKFRSNSTGEIFNQPVIYQESIKFILQTTNYQQAKPLTKPSNTLESIHKNLVGSGVSKVSSLSIYNPEMNSPINDSSINSGAAQTSNEINLYHLPWNVRGLIQDLLRIKNINGAELITELINSYRGWEPTAKHMKELKLVFEVFDTELDELVM